MVAISGAVLPVRSFSSMLTTKVLQFRNPQGREENWLSGEERIHNYFIHAGKVVTTEVAVAVLAVVAVIETVAYGVLVIGSLSIRAHDATYYNRFSSLFSSAGFTVLWNFGNLIIFNPLCTNIATEEPFARYTIDYWPRGEAFKTVLKLIGAVTYALATRNTFNSYNYNRESIFSGPYLRDEDRLYIINWFQEHRMPAPQFQRASPVRPAAFVHPVSGYRQEAERIVNEGSEFFKEYILAEGKTAAASKQLIREFDPDVFTFVVTKAVYEYVFGALRDAGAPRFFKAQTQQDIISLRQKYVAEQGRALQPYMFNHTHFEEAANDRALRTIFNDLRNIASRELQGGIFATKCWQKACGGG
jgi:hypothetical protein